MGRDRGADPTDSSAASLPPQRPRERVQRTRVEALEGILGEPLPVLDAGFVRVIDYMGSDDSIVQAARVSYGAGTKRVHEDRGLIRYLLRHEHTTPFEMCEIKLHVRVPMDCWRQWIRHRTASINEVSTRYSVAIDAAQRTPPDEWREQAGGNRQGSGRPLAREVGDELSREESDLQERSREVYRRRLALNVAREQARKDLPLSTYTEAYWKIDLHNLFHFLKLRMHDTAQLEIRSYAKTIGEKVVAVWCPIAWEAFCDYHVNALRLSRLEREVILALNQDGPREATELATRLGLLVAAASGFKPNRERAELEAKLRELGLPVPWSGSVAAAVSKHDPPPSSSNSSA